MEWGRSDMKEQPALSPFSLGVDVCASWYNGGMVVGSETFLTTSLLPYHTSAVV